METELLKLKSRSVSETETIKRAARLLHDGAIVAFPTETVYGMGANAQLPETVEQLYEIKGRPRSKPFTVHVADLSDVSELVGSISTLGQRLIERCWPGPLTIIFTRADGSTVGIRLPDHDVARELIRKADCPVLAPSANLFGKPPATSAVDVIKTFDGKISAVLDGGPTRFGESSTVVRLVGTDYKIVREGALSAARLRRAMNVSVLFVCSGNSCRSPIAEALCRRMLSARLRVKPTELVEHGYNVTSCGTSTTVGMPASVEVRQIADELGLDLSEHISRPVTERMLRWADLIYVMTSDQMESLLKLCPEATGKIMLLDPKGRAIADPHGGDLETYRRCAFLIQEALRKRLQKL